MNNEEINFIKKIVSDANYSFLSKEDIIANFEELGFLVNENNMIGYTSYLEYDRNNKKRLISFDKNKSLKEQQQILLMNYCAYLRDKQEFDKFYYKDIPEKSTIKRLCRYIIDYSVEKEFGSQEYNNNAKKGRCK